jgi:hypothetical protein
MCLAGSFFFLPLDCTLVSGYPSCFFLLNCLTLGCTQSIMYVAIFRTCLWYLKWSSGLLAPALCVIANILCNWCFILGVRTCVALQMLISEPGIANLSLSWKTETGVCISWLSEGETSARQCNKKLRSCEAFFSDAGSCTPLGSWTGICGNGGGGSSIRWMFRDTAGMIGTVPWMIRAWMNFKARRIFYNTCSRNPGAEERCFCLATLKLQ